MPLYRPRGGNIISNLQPVYSGYKYLLYGGRPVNHYKPFYLPANLIYNRYIFGIPDAIVYFQYYYYPGQFYYGR